MPVPYIAAMTSRALVREVMENSVALMRRAGQMPKAFRVTVARERGMMSPVRGRAIRFVRRKWIGKELK